MDERPTSVRWPRRRSLDDMRRSRCSESVAAGATLLTGGEPLDGPGNFYAPTVLADIPRGRAGVREEMFGPVAAVFRVRDVDEAIRLANDTPLRPRRAASGRTTRPSSERFIDEHRGRPGLRQRDGRLRSARCRSAASSTPATAASSACYGIREFVNVKTVYVSSGESGEAAKTE